MSGYTENKEASADLLRKRMLKITELCWGGENLSSNDPAWSRTYEDVMRLRDQRDEYFNLCQQLMLEKMDYVWRDRTMKDLWPTRGKWKCRYNQPDILIFEVREGENAIVFARNGKWVAGEQHYPTPLINNQSTHKTVHDAMRAAIKAAMPVTP